MSASCAWAQRIIAPAIPVQSQNTEFIKAVHAALELLRGRAPQDFEFARAHVGRIVEVSRWEDVGMAVMHKPPLARLRRQEVMGSRTWLASVIVHEACHRFPSTAITTRRRRRGGCGGIRPLRTRASVDRGYFAAASSFSVKV